MKGKDNYTLEVAAKKLRGKSTEKDDTGKKKGGGNNGLASASTADVMSQSVGMKISSIGDITGGREDNQKKINVNYGGGMKNKKPAPIRNISTETRVTMGEQDNGGKRDISKFLDTNRDYGDGRKKKNANKRVRFAQW